MTDTVDLNGESLVEGKVALLLELAGYVPGERAYSVAQRMLSPPVLLGLTPSQAALEDIYTDAVRDELKQFNGDPGLGKAGLERQILGAVGQGLVGEIAGPLSAPRRIAYAGLSDPPSWAADELPPSDLPTELTPSGQALNDAVDEFRNNKQTLPSPQSDVGTSPLRGAMASRSAAESDSESTEPTDRLQQVINDAIHEGYSPATLESLLQSIAEAPEDADPESIRAQALNKVDNSGDLQKFFNLCLLDVHGTDGKVSDIKELITQEADNID